MLLHHYDMFPGKRPPQSTPEPEPQREEDRELTAEEQRLSWRYLMLIDLGFAPDDALHLIRNPHLDWHDAERLVKKGCPKELILRILEVD